MNEMINYGGAVELSTNDYTDLPSTVIFFKSCNFNCCYCHNQELITGCNMIPISDVKEIIDRTKKFVSAVVFTGGEPTLQPKSLSLLATYVKECGLKVGLNTNGYKPDVVLNLLYHKLLDKVFIDVKTSLVEPDKYHDLIQVDLPHLTGNINKTLCMIADADVDVEVRTTAFRSLHKPEDIIEIMRYLDSVNTCYGGKGTFTFKLQTGRKKDGDPCENPFDIEAVKKMIEGDSFSFDKIII
ncbi:anaerobic ribonucleoside-triphosphate reductase activating protein [Candidatus Dependentiae bacterium]|nr:anaerobic ribonucleoside-triphosphate reductase activating protein [Candidatus Dependentiae bacterium]